MTGGDWICTACADRTAEPGEHCGEARLDMRQERVRDLLRDIDLRAEQSRETRVRFMGVGISVVALFGLWCIPGYWEFERTIALPFFADQIAIAVGIALLVIKLAGRKPKKFPFVDAEVA